MHRILKKMKANCGGAPRSRAAGYSLKIKSGYIEKKYNAIKNEDEDLITIYNLIKIVIEDMDNTKFDIIDNLSFKTTKDLGLFDDYMAEYNYYEYDLRS